MNLKNFIVPAKLKNTDELDFWSNPKFHTQDLVFIDSSIDLDNHLLDERAFYPTDYAIVNGVETELGQEGQPCSTWLRNACDNVVKVYTYQKELSTSMIYSTKKGICPCIYLDADKVAAIKKVDNNAFKINAYIDRHTKDFMRKYYTIEFGNYPQNYVGDYENLMLDKMITMEDPNLKATGKFYTGFLEPKTDIYNQNPEFKYLGKKYVHVATRSFALSAKKQPIRLANGTEVEHRAYMWFEVTPLEWEITNWEQLPKSINPNGSGKTNLMHLRCKNVIMAGLPFNTSAQPYSVFWKDSIIRSFLNGTENQNLNEANIFFRKNNFLAEAFDISDFQKLSETNKPQKRNGYGVEIKDDSLSIKEQINFYIKHGKSFMLHGPSGVGKSRRIHEADPDLTSIVLRNGILPEEVIGKNIYPNNDATKSGTWVAPEWYVKLCEKCKKQPNKNHVLFIDEITNVKPTEQSLVFHLILNRAIAPNVGKLPENVVVVAAGNRPEDSEAAYNLPEPLFRRFEGHIYLEPNIIEWLGWANERKADGKTNIHPLVSIFVGEHSNNVFYTKYNADNPSQFAVDPRGWEQISNMIYSNKPISQNLIENKVGKSIAISFMAFMQKHIPTMQDILDNNYTPADLPQKVTGQYALISTLATADKQAEEKITNFVRTEFGESTVKTYELLCQLERISKCIEDVNEILGNKEI